jgi:hypothetical protein
MYSLCTGTSIILVCYVCTYIHGTVRMDVIMKYEDTNVSDLDTESYGSVSSHPQHLHHRCYYQVNVRMWYEVHFIYTSSTAYI